MKEQILQVRFGGLPGLNKSQTVSNMMKDSTGMLPKLHILEKTKIILYEKYHMKIKEAPSENMIAVLEEIESIISEINGQIFQIIETEYTRDFDTRMSVTDRVPNLNMTTENAKIDNGALNS